MSLPVTWEELEAAIEAKNSSQLYWLADDALKRVRKVGDLFAPVLKLKQELPQAFAASTTPRLKPARRGLHRPAARASEQGGRRRLILAKAQSGFELCMHIQEEHTCWSFKAVPRKGKFIEITAMPSATPSRIAAETGTVELVEGSHDRGWMHFFFASGTLAGDWVLARAREKWVLARPPDAPPFPNLTRRALTPA